MPIAWWALVGLFAALIINRAADCWLSGAPLQCGLTRHPRRQAAVVVGVPLLFAAQAAVVADPGALAAACLFSAVLVLLAVIDLEQRRVPNIVVWPGLLLALGFAATTGDLPATAAGALLALLVFLGLHWLGARLFGPGALGMGDVKLAMLVGAMVGLRLMPLALLAGVLLAGVAAAVLLATGRARPGDALPFGHFLALGALVVLLAAALPPL